MADYLSVVEAVAQIKPLLAGKSPDVQGIILAQLVAMWLGGYHHADGPIQTNQLRVELIAAHIDLVLHLLAAKLERAHGESGFN